MYRNIKKPVRSADGSEKIVSIINVCFHTSQHCDLRSRYGTGTSPRIHKMLEPMHHLAVARSDKTQETAKIGRREKKKTFWPHSPHTVYTMHFAAGMKA